MITAADFLKWLKVFNIQSGGGGGSGTVTSVTGGSGLNGGTITTSGTLSVKLPSLTVRVASEFNLSATYANGTAGVGATLTNAGTLGTITIDGQILSVGDRIIVVGQTNQIQNGIYQVTIAGNGSTAWVITRTIDFNTVAQMIAGTPITVNDGDNLAGSIYVLINPSPIAIGTNNIIFSSMLELANAIIDAYLPLSGGTLTGDLILNADATDPLGAVTLQQLNAAGNLTPQNIQDQDFIYNTTVTTSPDVYTLSLTPPLTAYQAGQIISFTADSTNTNAVDGTTATLNVDGLGAIDLRVNTLGTITPVYKGGIVNGSVYHVLYDGTYGIILNPSVAVMGNDLVNQFWTYSTDSGSLNAYSTTIPLLVLDGVNLFDGTEVTIKAGTTNTGSSTLNVNASGDKTIVLNDGSTLIGNEMLSGGLYRFNARSNEWVLLNPEISASGGVTEQNIQNQDFIFQANIGNTGNDYTITLSPPLTAYQDGQRISFTVTAANTNTQQGSNTHFDIDGLGNLLAVVNSNGVFTPIYAGALKDGGSVYTGMVGGGGSYFIIENPSTTVDSVSSVSQTWIYADTTGSTPDAYTLTIPQLVITTLGDYKPGTKVCFKAVGDNTGAVTVSINGNNVLGLSYNTGSSLQAGAILNNGYYEIEYNYPATFVLLNPSDNVTTSQVQISVFNAGVDNGTLNAFNIDLGGPATFADASPLWMLPKSTTNVINPTLSINGGTPLQIFLPNGFSPFPGDILLNSPALFAFYNGTPNILNPMYMYTMPKDVLQGRYIGYQDTGTTNAYVADANQNQPTANFNFCTMIVLIPANTNTGASTLNFNGSGATAITYKGAALTGGEIVANIPCLFVGDGTQWNLISNYGTTPISRGGTGVTSLTTVPTASAFAGWDANANLSADNFLEGYTTTATAAGTTTLTVDSTYQQFFTGTTTQTVKLPVTSTLALGQSFWIVNNSTGNVTVQSSGSNTIQIMAANTALLVRCILTSGTGIASWDARYFVPPVVTAGGTNSVRGLNSTAAGTSSLAIGNSASAAGNNAIAVGASANASQDSSVALGSSATATGAGGSTAIGQGASATGQTSIAIGFSAAVNSESAVALGESASANANFSYALGESATTGGTSSYAFGKSSATNNNGSFVFCDSSGSKKTDTTTNQIVMTFANGFLFYKNSTTPLFQVNTVGDFITNRGTCDQSYSYQTPTTGFSITIGANVKTLLLDPAGTLATGTITMPAAPVDGQEIRVSSSQTVTALTVSPNTGQTVSNAPTTLMLGNGFAYIYRLSNTTWYRIY